MVDSLFIVVPIDLECSAWCLYCFAVSTLSFLSSFAIISLSERAAHFTVIVFLLSCGCYCSVFLPQGFLGWSAVCDCGISWSYSLY